MYQVSEGLKAWATPAQVRYIDAILLEGSVRKAAKRLGMHHKTLQKGVKLVHAKAAAQGYAPEYGMNHPVPAPFIVKGQSVMSRIHPDGTRTPLLEWNLVRMDDQKFIENIQAGIEAFMREQEPIKAVGVAPKQRDLDIIPWIQIGDAHLGMLAHEAETGANFDLKIAERELIGAIDMLIDEMEPTERMVLNDVGDFTHYENMAGVTEASGHMLDYDGRFPKMIDIYSRIMRHIIDKCLTKTQYLDVIINQGNHSRTNDIWMAVLIKSVYGETGRVTVLNNHTPFIGYRMGKTFVMTHHSDKAKPHRLASVMATDFAQDWGETDYRYIDIGHIHHSMVLKEHPGVVIESWNQLAAKDKWATDGGYRSRQSISIVYRSRSYGEVGRKMLPLRRVQDAIEAAALARGDKAPYRPKAQRAYSV